MKKDKTICPNLRFLIVGPELQEFGGADRYMFDQANLLSKNGFEVKCIAFSGGSLENAYKKQGISYLIQPISQIDPRKIHDLVLDYDFVIANTMYTIFFAYEAQKYKPTMLIIHDPLSYMEYIFSRTLFSWQELKKIRHKFGVSRVHVDVLKEIGLESTEVLNNFIPDIYLKSQKCPKDSLKIKFLTVANWHHVKGYDLALNAFRRLSNEEKELIEWHIVGHMSTETECIKFQQDIDAETWIHLHGSIMDKKHLYKLYEKSDIYIHMSREEPCSLAVIDAAMMQKPLIVSKDVGAKYLADNGAGWIVNEYDNTNIVNAIREALNQKEVLNNMGMIARKNYLASATPEAYYQPLIQNCSSIWEADSILLKNQHYLQHRIKREKKELRIALYGYNLFTQIEYFYYRVYHPYKLDGIYDQAYEQYAEQIPNIKNPAELKSENFDFICICCIFESTINEIKNTLIKKGIPAEKICVGVKAAFESPRRK